MGIAGVRAGYLFNWQNVRIAADEFLKPFLIVVHPVVSTSLKADAGEPTRSGVRKITDNERFTVLRVCHHSPERLKPLLFFDCPLNYRFYPSDQL
jgi:hypothetical protein